MAALPAFAYRRAAARTCSAGTPVTFSMCLGRAIRMRNERFPLLVRRLFAPLRNVTLARQSFRHDHMRQRIHHGDVRSRTQLQVIVRLHVRRAHDADGAWIDDDEMRALSQPLLQLRREDRMTLGRIRADEQESHRTS